MHLRSAADSLRVICSSKQNYLQFFHKNRLRNYKFVEASTRIKSVEVVNIDTYLLLSFIIIGKCYFRWDTVSA